MYVERAYRNTWIGDHFEAATNFNPLLIFILVPIVAALTQKRKVYTMMIAGTAVMAAPTFLLAIGPTFWTLLGYLVLMTVGEAMWQPRFLQYAAEIAPEGRTGAYMGVAQFPWFLTKVVTSLYSGWFLTRYCPAEGPTNTETMWLIYGLIAMLSALMLHPGKGMAGQGLQDQGGLTRTFDDNGHKSVSGLRASPFIRVPRRIDLHPIGHPGVTALQSHRYR